jgi:hypothetical protein
MFDLKQCPNDCILRALKYLDAARHCLHTAGATGSIPVPRTI